MSPSVTIKRKRGKITEINLTGKAASNFFKALMQAQEKKDDDEANKARSDDSHDNDA